MLDAMDCHGRGYERVLNFVHHEYGSLPRELATYALGIYGTGTSLATIRIFLLLLLLGSRLLGGTERNKREHRTVDTTTAVGGQQHKV